MFKWVTNMLTGGYQPSSIATEVGDDMTEETKARVPSGQFLTEKFPVLTFGGTPKIDMAKWRFRVFGLVEEKLELTWDEFTAMPPTTLTADFHCVTTWSRLDNAWTGVSINEVMKRIKPLANAGYVMFHCYGGYTANISMDVLLDDDVLFAYQHDGATPRSRPRWPAPPCGAQALRLEEPKMGKWHGVHGARQAGLLGAKGLPHGRRSVEGAAVQLVAP